MAPPSDPNAPVHPPTPKSADDASNVAPPKRPSAPPPRPARPPPIARPKDASGPFADLPDLPKMATGSPKRNLTLVGMLQTSTAPGASRNRFVLSAVGLVVLVAIVTSVLYRRTLVKHLVPKHAAVHAPNTAPPAPVLTPEQQAARALAAGSEAYAHRDYGKAVASFEEALNLDPSLADAHRSLGIVHADLHDEAEAIAHYQKYIEMLPHARDSARVKKIIDDYNTAHAPPPEPPPAAKVPVKAHRANKALKH